MHSQARRNFSNSLLWRYAGRGGVKVGALCCHRAKTLTLPSPGVPGEGKRRAAFTLLELSICVILIGILVGFTVPSFSRVSEQNHVDAAAQYLRSIWSAQRVYWLENRTFTDSLANLNSLGLIDPKIAGGDDGYFQYTITAATSNAFSVTAIRHGSSVWSGTLTITQDGEVTGFVSGSSSSVLTPPDI
jgi:prepilin-type N-terminal cleavage/methylation domain-containing protein